MTSVEHRPDRATLARRFRDFSATERTYSPLYSRLAAGCAGDPEILDLLAVARTGQRRPVLLMAAVHDLLLAGAEHPLRRFYPSVGGDAGAGDPFPAFRDFCLTHRDALLATVSTRTTQTNEVRRCTGLYPALSAAARVAGGGPLALVEIGTSTGLNLRLDRYGYRYSTGQRAGDPDSPLLLDCEVSGPFAPPAGAGVPPPRLAARVGVDLAPGDVADGDAVRWRAACVFADQPERIRRLRAAVDIARRHPVRLVAGDALDALPGVVADLPEGATPCLLHSWVVWYFPHDARDRLVTLVGELAARRPVVWIASEPAGTVPGLGERAVRDESLLGLAHVTGPGSGVRWRVLGEMHSHGAWLSWTDAGTGRPLGG